MDKIIYYCPHAAECPLRKCCRAFTVSREISTPVDIWLKCDAIKKKTAGKETEICTRITSRNKLAMV